MKRTKRSIVLSSVFAIIFCVSMIAGGTFALFTSESKVNIAVSSGKVAVEATIDGLTLYSPKAIDQSGNVTDATNAASTNFANGGTATLEANALTLTNVTPGDKASFTVNVKNNSNVAIKYRTILACETNTGLFAGLKVTVDGEEYIGRTKVTEWTELAAGAGDYSFNVEIELPTTAGNEYQDKSIKLYYTVQAVQGNTDTEVADTNTYYIYGANDLVLLRYFAQTVNNVVLMDDVDMEGVEYTAWDFAVPSASTFTFDGNGYSIKNLTTTGYTGENTTNDFQRSGLFANVTSAATSSEDVYGKIVFQNLTIDGANVAQTVGANATAGALIGIANFVNVEINGCSVINSNITSGKYAAGFVGYAQEFADFISISISDATVKDNKIGGNGHAGGLVGLANKTVNVVRATIENNVISTKFGHSAAALLGTGSLSATGVTANRNTYAGGLKDCNGDTKDETFGIYHKQLGDYTITGTGTNNTVYTAYAILNLADLKEFRDLVNAGTTFLQNTNGLVAETVPHNVLLLADIDLGNEEWTPIGTFDNPFEGDFDGMGHTISNLKITSGQNVGLFGQITMKGGVNYLPGVFNLTLKNVNITADGSGAFVGNSYVTTNNAGNGGCLVLSNLKLIGDVKIEGKDVGGIMGTEWTDFQISGQNIEVNVNAGSYVKGTGTVGGVFASAPHAHLNYITSNINVYVSGSYKANETKLTATAGGIVGCAGWDVGCNSDNIYGVATPDYSGSIVCTGNVYVTGIDETESGKYAVGKIVGSEANNPYWPYYKWADLGSFFRNFTANNSISITLTNGGVLTSNGMNAEDRHGDANAVVYTQSLVGTAIWPWNLQEYNG